MSKVYFTNMRTAIDDSLLKKLRRLILAAGMEELDFEGKFTAIKMHFGEPGNLAFLRPNFVRVVADEVKRLGGSPFLTDCSTLYPGRRKNAIEHLAAAAENGFSYMSCQCPVIIADGIKGTDEALVPLEGTDLVKTAKIGRAVADADIVISLNHFKGHEYTGFGGAIKNLGMGCGSKAGKMEQHGGGVSRVDQKLCRSCRRCMSQCAHGAISYGAEGKASIDVSRCVGCARCHAACPFDAIRAIQSNSEHDLCVRIAEYALAVVRGKPNFHINIVNQVSPYCDCHGENDLPIIPDVGMFASFDPVALDKACADACNTQSVIPGSMLADKLHDHGGTQAHGDHFTNAFRNTDWRVTLEQAQKIGIGEQSYELVTIQ